MMELTAKELQLEYLKSVLREIGWVDPYNPYSERLSKYLKPKHVRVDRTSIMFRFSETSTPYHGDLYVFAKERHSNGWRLYVTPISEAYVVVHNLTELNHETFYYLLVDKLKQKIDEHKTMEMLYT
jgi:hypothetical protein